MCAAEETCPWMNAATAGGLLGGDVTATVNSSDKSKEDATCDFVHRQGPLVQELMIEVRTMAAPGKDLANFLVRCEKATPLKAIGNEAVVCDVSKPGEIVEQVVGRVRERAFVIRATSDDPRAAQTSFREKAIKAAEQVAGNLF